MGILGHRWHRSSFTSVILSIITAGSIVSAQTISTDSPVPPLQWINLTPLLNGASPPPLKDASIGYDDTSRTLLIFGGESQQGFPQSQTYLLNLSSLTWSTPSSPANLNQQPPARSAAISAQDNAASYRTGHIVFGGRGANGEPLSDAWEFSYNAQFWSQIIISPGGPSARWAAAGGNDIRSTDFQDQRLTAPNNSFYLAGGFDSQGAISLSDVWRFNVSGILSPNLPNNVVGSWEKLSLENNSLPATGGSAAAAILQSPDQYIVAVGGCSVSSGADAACAESTSYVLNVDVANDQSISSCPAPRVGASLTPNLSGASSSFGQQAFLLLGTFNSSVWQDDGGLDKGEVDVLNIITGAWARILPAGDPSGGNVSFPTPREGAAVVTFQNALVGLDSSRGDASDTIVFGGRDATGNYLNEHWSGFGSGNLQSGINADGEGVAVTYMSKCATQIGLSPAPPNQPSSTSSGLPVPSSSAGQGQGQGLSKTFYPFDTSTIHKALAPISVGLVFPAVLLYRLSHAPVTAPSSLARNKPGFAYLAGLFAVAAFALGLAGLATAFTSIKSTTPLAKRSSSVPNLTTTHGRAGLALFIGLYGLVPIVLAASLLRRWSPRDTLSHSPLRPRKISNELAEKQGLYQGRAASPGPQLSMEGRQTRVRSGDSLGPWSAAGHTNGTRMSSDSISAFDERSSPSTRSFEVTNRPTRARHASAHSLAAFADGRPSVGTRNLSDMRSPSRLDDIDRRAKDPSTPGTAVMELTSNPKSLAEDPNTALPPFVQSLTHVLLHAFLLGLCILSLVALRQRAPTAPFAIFLAWVVCFYALIFILAWHGIPRVSILTVLIRRLRAHPPPPQTPTMGLDDVVFPGAPGLYQHQPPYRTTYDSEYPTSISHAGHTMEDDAASDDDDDTRQRRIEDEMSRREVSIVTVPRRKLMVINPSHEPS